MDFMAKEEFINESNIEIIQKLMERNNGYITTKELENFDISRNYLSIMTKRNMIEKVAKGIYIDFAKIEDIYYVLSVSTPKIIYSHMTALYFHNLSIKAPDGSFDITVTKKYNNPKLKKHNVFYVDDKFYNVGITEVETPQGNKVKAYDIERCICDIIRSKKRMDLEHVKYAIKEKPRVSVVIVKETKNMIPKDTLIKIADDYGRDRVEFDVVDGNYKGDIEFDGISINTLPWKKECNNTEMLNYGIEKTKNEYILVLSSYIIKVSDNYIETFVSNTMRKNVGAVGGKMYFSNGTIKNAGLFIKKDGTIEEVFKKLPRLCVGYMNRQSMQQNMQAITFDDIMFKKSLWEKIKNGISKSKSLQRDVEICTKIRGNDLLLVYTPWAESMVRKER
mgnify:CR=1 FL=1